MLHYDLELFYRLFNSLSILSNANMTFFSPDRKNLPASSVPLPYLQQNKFCVAVHNEPELIELCKASDINAFNSFKNSDHFFVYKCHCGLIEIALRIMQDDELLGYVLIGPFRDPKTKAADLMHIEKLAQKYELSEKKLKNNYFKIAPFSKNIEFSLKTLCSVLFEYMENKNCLFRTRSIFSMQILPYLKKNLRDSLTIDLLCKNFSVSQKMLYRIFHENTGMTPKEYILNLRIEEALKLIIQSDQSIAQIADNTGFSDYSYFIKIFKYHIGNSPSYYRKRSIEADLSSLGITSLKIDKK